jgi:maltooligosyltrehalose trehalohydrolase
LSRFRDSTTPGSFRVWAPNAKSVELITEGRRFELATRELGWFVLEPSPLREGSDYLLSLDGGPAIPDPRSGFQPEGVHGPTRHVTGSEFAWTDGGFRAVPLASAIFYELHVGTFAEDGTFDGVIARLPHLRALGVTHVELMPVAQFPGKHGWGYDGVQPYAPQNSYGGPVALKRLVDAFHGAGIAVVLDVVYNHLGPDGNHLSAFGPYLTDIYETAWGQAVNLDGPHSALVRRYFLDNALYWLEEFHLDGLRLDAIHALYDHSARPFLRQLAEETAELSRHLAKPLVLIAESDLNDPRLVRSRDAGGFGLDAQWSDDLHHALHVVLTGERAGIHGDFSGLADLAKALEGGFVYDGRYSSFRKRPHGAPLDPSYLARLVVCLQNHDQVGNRARGERIGQLVSQARAKLGAAIVLLGPSVPLLFQGEEWDASTPFQYFTDHTDPGLAQAVRDGRRREFAEFGWDEALVPDPQAADTFLGSRLRFEELTLPRHSNMFEFYRSLIRLRRSTPELTAPLLGVQYDESRGVLIMERDRSQVALNFSREAQRMPGAPWSDAKPPEVLYATEGASVERGPVFVLPPESLVVARASGWV